MTLAGYDNEPSKGHQRHYGNHEEPCHVTTPDRLIADLLADLHTARRARRH